MSQQPYLSVIIPSYNEQRNVGRGVLDNVLSYLQKQNYTWELIFSDDGSTDDTTTELEKFTTKDSEHMRLLKNVHAGKGPTVQSGMLAARGEWRLFTDFDQSTPLSEIEKLLPFTKDFDVIIGSREIAGAKRDKEPLIRHFMGKGFNVAVQMLAVPGIFDTQCGFKLFSSQSAEKLFSSLYIYGRKDGRNDAFTGAFDVEALFLARKFGFRIKEVPIHWHHNKTDRVSPVKDSLRMFRDILFVRKADLFGKYPHAKNSPA